MNGTNTIVGDEVRDRMVVLHKGLGELLRELGIEIGVNEDHARALRYFNPVISTPVGNLGGAFRNVEVSKLNGATIAYHQAEYLWQGQTIRAVVRCEIGKDGRPFVAQAFPHKATK